MSRSGATVDMSTRLWTAPCPKCGLPLVASDRKRCPRCRWVRVHGISSMWQAGRDRG